MKIRTFLLICILSLPLSFLCAKNVKTTVYVDYNKLAPATVNVKFTSDRVSGTSELQTEISNFKAYDDLSVLSYQSDQGPKEGILLKTEMKGNELKAKSVNDCYVSWQSYVKDYATVYLETAGPLKSTKPDSQAVVHWTIKMSAEPYASCSSENESSFIKVVDTIPRNFGVTGSRKFTIETQNLWDVPLESYKANIRARIEAK